MSVHLKVQVWIFRQQKTSKDLQTEVLLLLTHKGRGGFWQPVTGHVDSGETLKEAAVREVKEETGLNLKEIFKLSESRLYLKRTDKHTKSLFFILLCPIQNPQIKLKLI